MDCFNCGSSNIFMIFDEIFRCPHCDEDIHIGYYGCNECGGIWYGCDDEVINGMVIDGDAFADENTEFLKEIANGLKSEDAFLSLLERGDIKQLEEEDKDCMGELVHRCLKCNSIAYEIEEGVYRCSDENCGFEWEVIKCG